jgi:glycyl-tRNA synthetase beta chain
MADILFELGVEEVPVGEIEKIILQLKEKFELKLKEHQVEFKKIESAATNKRFMIYINQVNDKVKSKEECILGPSKKIAYSDDSKPTMALTKFLEGHQAKLKDVIEIETKKGIYTGINKEIEGKPVTEIAADIGPQILKELSFSKTMLWNESRTPFIRPIKNILLLFDSQLIKCEYAGIQSSVNSRGHLLLSDAPVEINSYKEYIEKLFKNFVIVREEERKEKIVDEIIAIEQELDAHVHMTDYLLQYYVYSNEYPVVYTGTFDKKYLSLPAEIISTFMIKEKKLLPIYDSDNNLMNIFVGVSNIPDENKFVLKGNERVIQAAFEDANFFWDMDREDDFFFLRENLKELMFHKDLGTFYEKTDRLPKISEFILQQIGKNDLAQALHKASVHCKNDLVTRMVREFPSLQGIMGGLYLMEKGESEEIWKAVYGHYEPRGFTDVQLDNLGAAVLSMADKMDNISSFISKGFKISSSKDPYGVRRDANAIIKLIIDFKLDFPLNSLIDYAAETVSDNIDYQKKLSVEIYDFLKSRIENAFKDNLGFRYDIVNATLNDPSLPIYKMYLKAKDISKISESESLKYLVSFHKRIKNIIKDTENHNISENLLVEPEEKILFEVFKDSKADTEKLILSKKYVDACSRILEMKPTLDIFFEKVMVNAEDEKLRANRMALLQKLDELLSKISDFSLIVQ